MRKGGRKGSTSGERPASSGRLRPSSGRRRPLDASVAGWAAAPPITWEVIADGRLRREHAGMDTDDPRSLLATMPFATFCGIEYESAVPDEVRASLAWAPERCTAAGVLHGGVLMTLADTAGAICAFLNLPAGASTSTLESKTNFFRAVRGGTVEAVARPLHVGRTTVVVQTDIHDGDGRRVAQTTQTQAVLPAPG
jgi:1,4-dihydroxy-2-naphthoyl-CoA hydrolase